ncbi:hypothetical protein MLN87_07385 [Escherichia coli]|nr:hypothetical protein [Escherichia coli]MCN8204086.1 hypothetical protein [Escherichia coli]HAI3384508.1 hypothetical protein [Escherichia coli]HAL0004646.1 hypothetical protein [Escherichia coli]HAP1523988.1 hypothetical protein [Escherichia coli]
MAIEQQNTNLLAPSTTPDNNSTLNAYRAHAAAIRGEAQATGPATPVNPFHSNSQDDQAEAQQKHYADMQRALSPIQSVKFDVDEQYTDEKHQNFMKNLENNPVLKEIGEPMQQLLDNLLAGINAGKISQSDALDVVAQYGDEAITPLLEKHHGKHSETHKSSLHDKQPEELPDVVKKVKGIK